MDVGLTRSDTSLPGLAMAAAARPPARPDKVTETASAPTAYDDRRGQIRDEVLVDHGLNLGVMARLPAEARLRTGARVENEVARRLAPGRVLDLRV